MARVKGGTTSLKRRKSVLERAKGYRHGRSKKERYAKEALVHAGKYSFAHRRDKKNDFRRLWIVRINAAIREQGVASYSVFMKMAKAKGIEIDRKSLAELAGTKPDIFNRLVKKIVA